MIVDVRMLLQTLKNAFYTCFIDLLRLADAEDYKTIRELVLRNQEYYLVADFLRYCKEKGVYEETVKGLLEYEISPTLRKVFQEMLRSEKWEKAFKLILETVEEVKKVKRKEWKA